MPRFLLKLALLMTLFLTVTSLAVRTVGSIQPPNPALRGFTEGCEDKPQPCWYGIVPGVTDRKQAHILLSQYRYPSECVNIGNLNDLVSDLELWPCTSLPQLYFGDVVSQFGPIKGVTVIPIQRFPNRTGTQIIENDYWVDFENQFVSVPIDDIRWLQHRFMTAVSVSVFAESTHQIGLKWYGNIPAWKLCQLEPNYYVCGFCNLISEIAVYDKGGVCK